MASETKVDEKRQLPEDSSNTGVGEPPAKRSKLSSNLSSSEGDHDDGQKKIPRMGGEPNPANDEGGPKEKVEPVNPDEYVRVIPVYRKPAGEQQVGWHPVQLSKLDKASQMEVSECRTRVTSRKGYRMIRATHGCYKGTWYYEVTPARLGKTGHCRVGWATKRAEVQAPIGFDQYGFSYRDIQGTKQHKALREDYGDEFHEGDVIGCWIHLGEGGRPLEKKQKEIVRWRGILHYVDEPDIEPNVLPGTQIVFSKNGVAQGVAYWDIFEGTYYPAGSIFTHPDEKEGAALAFNFGPDFKYPPPKFEELGDPRPISELAGSPPTNEEVAVEATDNPSKSLSLDPNHEDQQQIKND